MATTPHPELQDLRTRLTCIHEALENFKSLIARPPILDSSFDSSTGVDVNEENQWLHQENIPGLKKLKENIKIDLGILDKFLEDPACTNLPPLSTNAPYVIAVWNELLCSPPPVVSVFKTFLLKPAVPGIGARSSNDKAQKRPVQLHPPGAKVDVVADNGRRWIRVNTIKNSRLQSEFREIDSYLTESEDEADEDWDDAQRPTLAQTEFDNSVLRMGRSLLGAARANVIEGTTEIPKVTLCLTRLDPHLLNDNGTPPDARIGKTLDTLRNMGIDVQLGERTEQELPPIDSSIRAPSPSPLPLVPTLNINLDLSVLIALISDLTHAPIPQSIEEANKRFVPPPEYREWKQKRLLMTGKPQKSPSLLPGPGNGLEEDINDLPRDLIKHARALTNQLLQEMGKGMLQEIYDRLQSSSSSSGGDSGPKVTFWTTAEARERCLRIVSKIGGVHEKRRALALFRVKPSTGSSSGGSELSLDEASRLYWQDSRFSVNFIPLLPIQIFPSSISGADAITDAIRLNPYLETFAKQPKCEFGLELAKVCIDILAQETVPHPRALPEELVQPLATIPLVVDGDLSSAPHTQPELQRAMVTKASPRLTAHTVQSMQWGAQLGWTTLTANRTSVKAILRELRSARVAGRLAGIGGADQNHDMQSSLAAAMWIVDPRSLVEGMSTMPANRASQQAAG